MRIARLTALAGLAAAAAAFRAQAYEVNAWPAVVFQEDDAGQTQSWSALGPLLFSEPGPAPDSGRVSGLRPFYVELAGDECVKTDILYPLFYYRQYPDNYKWSVLQLINGEGVSAGAAKSAGPADQHFDIWPFYFSHETPDPSETYHALLPIYGTIKYRLGYDRISWSPFPVYVQTVKRGTQATYMPWPFVKIIQGPEQGFAIWPLFGITNGPGVSHHSFFAWPFIWSNTLAPEFDAPAGSEPSTQLGFLPFYTRERAPGSVSENYLWPFFGYTERTLPSRYRETRYFWPFLVQGHGDDGKLVERWGPFYTHSEAKGGTSTWVGWPLWHRSTWVDDDTAQARTQFFYFLYWSLDQTSVSRPALSPAYKRHIWPLLSIWDNGAGSRQVEFPSVFEVFFPSNPDIRQTWTPLFSIYRYDRRPTGESRSSLLWNAVTWRHGVSGRLEEFHLGPLIGMQRRAEGGHWSILGFDFGQKRDKGAKPQ